MDNFEILERIGRVDPPDPVVLGRAVQVLREAKIDANDIGPEGPQNFLGHVVGEKHRRSTRKFAFAAALVAAVCVAFAFIATQSSTPSFAVVMKQLAAAPRLSNEAGTVSIHQSLEFSGAGPKQRTDLQYNPATDVERFISHRPELSQADVGLFSGQWGYFNIVAKNPSGTIAASASSTARNWVRFPTGTITNHARVNSTVAGPIRGAQRVLARLGTRSSGGIAITGYRVQISVALLLKQASSKALQESYQTDYVVRGVKSFTANFWLDPQGRIRQAGWSYLVHGSPVTFAETASYSSTPLTFSVPPVGQTITSTDLISAEALAGWN